MGSGDLRVDFSEVSVRTVILAFSFGARSRKAVRPACPCHPPANPPREVRRCARRCGAINNQEVPEVDFPETSPGGTLRKGNTRCTYRRYTAQQLGAPTPTLGCIPVPYAAIPRPRPPNARGRGHPYRTAQACGYFGALFQLCLACVTFDGTPFRFLRPPASAPRTPCIFAALETAT